jgi:hypothetical protein
VGTGSPFERGLSVGNFGVRRHVVPFLKNLSGLRNLPGPYHAKKKGLTG